MKEIRRYKACERACTVFLLSFLKLRRDNVVYWKTKRKIKNDLRTLETASEPGRCTLTYDSVPGRADAEKSLHFVY